MNLLVEAIRPVWKLVFTAISTKGILMSAVVITVIHSDGLSNFQKALIIAGISASVTGIFTCFAAILAVRLQRPVQHDVQEIKEAVTKQGEHGE